MCPNAAVEYRFAYRVYRLPFRAPVRTGHGAWTHREGVLVRLTDTTGRVGYGEAAPIPWFGTETVDEIAAVCAALGEKVSDRDLDAVPDELGCLHNALRAARAGGLTRPENPAARPIAALLPAGAAAVAVLRVKLAAGFRVCKWKVGVADLVTELGLLDELCAELPTGAKLRLDANGAWDRRTAERWLERCAERPVEFVEQPCFAQVAARAAERAKAEDLLLGLAADYPTPLALDESLIGGGDVARWIGRGWPGYYIVKPSLVADVAGVLATLHEASTKVVFSSALETVVGARAALAAAFNWSGSVHALGFGVWPLFASPELNGPEAAPFVRWEDVLALNPEAAWNALN